MIWSFQNDCKSHENSCYSQSRMTSFEFTSPTWAWLCMRCLTRFERVPWLVSGAIMVYVMKVPSDLVRAVTLLSFRFIQHCIIYYCEATPGFQ